MISGATLLVAAACSSVTFSSKEVELIRAMYNPLYYDHSSMAKDLEEKLVARGMDILPCLEQIFRQGIRDVPQLDYDDWTPEPLGGFPYAEEPTPPTVDPLTDGYWAIKVIGKLAPRKAIALLRERLAELEADDCAILTFARDLHTLGSKTGAPFVAKYLESCGKDGGCVQSAYYLLSSIDDPRSVTALVKRLAEGSDPVYIQAGLQTAIWKLRRDYPSLTNAVRQSPSMSLSAASLLISAGKRDVVEQIMKEGGYPEGVDLSSLLNPPQKATPTGGRIPE